MKSSKLANVSVGIGGSLIIVIFVVLCLTIFSVLSFTIAYSDLKLSKKTEQIMVDYYAIHGKAEEKLAEINENLVKYDEDLSKIVNFSNFVEENVNKIKDVKVLKEDEKSVTIYYEALGDKNQKINVTLNILYDAMNDKLYYNIVSWNLSNIKLPEYEEEIVDLWEGTEE